MIKLSTSLLAGEQLISYAPDAFLWADQEALELLCTGHWMIWGASLRAEKSTDDTIAAAPFLAQAFTRARAMGIAGRWTCREGHITRELPGIEPDATKEQRISALIPPAGEYVSLDVERPASVNLVECGGATCQMVGKGPIEVWDQRALVPASGSDEARVVLQLRYVVALANAGALLLGRVGDPTAPVLIARSNGADILTTVGLVMPMRAD